MINYPNLYYGSKLIPSFLVNVVRPIKYINVNTLILDSDSSLSNELVCKFIDIYEDSLGVKEYIREQPIKHRKFNVNYYVVNYVIEKVSNKPEIKNKPNKLIINGTLISLFGIIVTLYFKSWLK